MHGRLGKNQRKYTHTSASSQQSTSCYTFLSVVLYCRKYEMYQNNDAKKKKRRKKKVDADVRLSHVSPALGPLTVNSM